MHPLKKQTLLLLFVLFSASVFGQFNRSYEDWFIGLHGGANSLWGDVTDNENHFIPGGPFQEGFYKDREFMWGASFGKNISPIYSLRAQFLFGPIKSHTVAENQYMRGDIRDYSGILNIDFIDLFNWSTKSNWDLYGLVGLGFTRFRSELFNSKNDSLLRYAPNDSLKYFRNKSITTLSLPIGIGVNYKIGNRIVINAESSIRYLNSDWLDALVDSKRMMEGFGYLSIGLIYRFDMPRTGSTWMRKSNHSFDSQKDNSGSSYRSKRRNGNIATDPFKNSSNRKSSIKTGVKRKKKVFKLKK